jgi:hypothetical protein
MKDSLNYSLSGKDILNKLDNKCNIVQYSDIHNFKTIDDLLGRYNKCVILYHTSENYGHWCCIYQYKNTIYFFDSYGFMIDDQLNFLHKDLRDDLNSDFMHLTKLLYNSKKKIEYNEYQLQARLPNVNTCGRWVICRLLYPQISIDDFYKIFKDASKYIDIDELICKLIKF